MQARWIVASSLLGAGLTLKSGAFVASEKVVGGPVVDDREVLCRSNDYAEPFAPTPMRTSPTSGDLSQPVGFVYHQAGEKRAEVYR